MSKGRRHAAGLLATLLFLLPAVPIGYANLRRWSLGRGLEPIGDNFFMYGALVVLMLPAALVSAACYRWVGAQEDRRRDAILYAVAGAAASGAFMTLLDAGEDYFSRPGIGWHLPVTGLVLGALFGGAFGVLGARSSR